MVGSRSSGSTTAGSAAWRVASARTTRSRLSAGCGGRSLAPPPYRGAVSGVLLAGKRVASGSPARGQRAAGYCRVGAGDGGAGVGGLVWVLAEGERLEKTPLRAKTTAAVGPPMLAIAIMHAATTLPHTPTQAARNKPTIATVAAIICPRSIRFCERSLRNLSCDWRNSLCCSTHPTILSASPGTALLYSASKLGGGSGPPNIVRLNSSAFETAAARSGLLGSMPKDRSAAINSGRIISGCLAVLSSESGFGVSFGRFGSVSFAMMGAVLRNEVMRAGYCLPDHREV